MKIFAYLAFFNIISNNSYSAEKPENNFKK